MALVYEVIRTHVLPFLDLDARISCNRALPKEYRYVMKVNDNVLYNAELQFIHCYMETNYYGKFKEHKGGFQDEVFEYNAELILKFVKFINSASQKTIARMKEEKVFALYTIAIDIAFEIKHPSVPHSDELQAELEKAVKMYYF